MGTSDSDGLFDPKKIKNPVLRALGRGYWVLDRIEWGTLLIFIGLILVLSLINIWYRQKAYQIIFWHLTFYSCLLGASLATGGERHISIDIFSRFLPKKLLPGLQVVMNLVSAVVCIVLTRACYQYMVFLQPDPSMPDMLPLNYVPEDPQWYWEQWRWKMPYIICFGLISFHFVVNVFVNGYRLIQGPQETPDDTPEQEVAS